MARVTGSLDDGRVIFGDPDETELKTAVDPVCGGEVLRAEAAGTVAYRGTVYYFCSSDCQVSFEAEPERYAIGR